MGGPVPKARIIKIGGFDHVESVLVGGDYPVVVQTMWKDRLERSDWRILPDKPSLPGLKNCEIWVVAYSALPFRI